MLKAVVCKVSDTAKKAWYYRNIVLFAEIFLVYRAISQKDFSLHFLKTQADAEQLKFSTDSSFLKMGKTAEISHDALYKLARYVCVFLSAARAAGGSNTCYVKSLLLAAYLARKGMSSTLHFTAGMRDGELSGHAYLEAQGKNIFGPVENFQPLFFFPESKSL